MKRDMNLARKILIEIEKNNGYTRFINLDINGYSQDEISYHVLLLGEANLIAAIDLSSADGPDYRPIRLTWEGHEFLEAAKDEKRWQQALQVIGSKGAGLVFEILKQVLVSLAKDAIMGHL